MHINEPPPTNIKHDDGSRDNSSVVTEQEPSNGGDEGQREGVTTKFGVLVG